MERMIPGNYSENDRQKMESFADYSDDDEDKAEKKSKRREARPMPGAFELSRDDRAAEKQADDDQPKQKEVLDRKQEDTAEKEEAVVPLDKLAEDEERMVVEQYVDARSEDLREDLASVQPDSPEEAAAVADMAFLESLQEKLNESDDVDETVLDAALAETIEDLDLSPDSEAADSPDDEVLDETEPADREAVEPEVPEAEETEGAVGTAHEADEPEDAASAAAPASPVPGPVPPAPPGGGGIAPPGGREMPAREDDAPRRRSPEPVTVETEDADEAWRANRRRRAGDLLLGGIIGYMIGRRGGRIRTEEKLLPIQKKLEEEVKTLQNKIQERETKIRQIAAEQVMTRPEKPGEVLANKLEQRQQRKQASLEKPETLRRPVAAERAANNREVEAFRRPEVLGRYAVPRPEAVSQPVEQLPDRSSENLSLTEVLQIASRIEQDGVSIKQMYERHQLDAEGVRKVVGEYLRGNRLDEILADYLRPDRLQGHEAGRSESGSQAEQAAGNTGSPMLPPSGSDHSTPSQAQTNMQASISASSNAPGRQVQKTVVVSAVLAGITVAVIAIWLILS